jgi:hypothetical protein
MEEDFEEESHNPARSSPGSSDRMTDSSSHVFLGDSKGDNNNHHPLTSSSSSLSKPMLPPSLLHSTINIHPTENYLIGVKVRVDLKMKQSLDRCSRLSSVHEQFKNLMV